MSAPVGLRSSSTSGAFAFSFNPAEGQRYESMPRSSVETWVLSLPTSIQPEIPTTRTDPLPTVETRKFLTTRRTHHGHRARVRTTYQSVMSSAEKKTVAHERGQRSLYPRAAGVMNRKREKMRRKNLKAKNDRDNQQFHSCEHCGSAYYFASGLGQHLNQYICHEQLERSPSPLDIVMTDVDEVPDTGEPGPMTHDCLTAATQLQTMGSLHSEGDIADESNSLTSLEDFTKKTVQIGIVVVPGILSFLDLAGYDVLGMIAEDRAVRRAPSQPDAWLPHPIFKIHWLYPGPADERTEKCQQEVFDVVFAAASATSFVLPVPSHVFYIKEELPGITMLLGTRAEPGYDCLRSAFLERYQRASDPWFSHQECVTEGCSTCAYLARRSTLRNLLEAQVSQCGTDAGGISGTGGPTLSGRRAVEQSRQLGERPGSPCAWVVHQA